MKTEKQGYYKIKKSDLIHMNIERIAKCLCEQGLGRSALIRNKKLEIKIVVADSHISIYIEKCGFDTKKKNT